MYIFLWNSQFIESSKYFCSYMYALLLLNCILTGMENGGSSRRGSYVPGTYWFNVGTLLKFTYCEKATNICYNLPLSFAILEQNFLGIFRTLELYKHTCGAQQTEFKSTINWYYNTVLFWWLAYEGKKIVRIWFSKQPITASSTVEVLSKVIYPKYSKV